MTALASPARAQTGIRTLLGIRMPLWGWVLGSRLLVLIAGVAGGLLTQRVAGWQAFDPTRMTTSLGSVGDVLSAPVLRWDSIHYLSISQHGYGSRGQTVFFPLYPLLIHAFGWFTGSDVVAGVLISLVSFTVALLLLHRLAREELGRREADATVLLVAFAPLSFFLTALYTESLFLALSVGAIYAAKHNRFAVAALAAAAAALTRVPGVIVLVPVGMFYWRSSRPRTGIALTLPLIAPAAFLVYLHSLGYGWLAPITNQETQAHSHSLAGPLVTVVDAIRDGLTGLTQTLHGAALIQPTIGGPYTQGFQNLVYLVVLVICVTTVVGTWRRLPAPYAVYASLTLLCCVWSPVAGRPLRSLDRYALVIFPLWMAAASWLRERGLTRAVLQISPILLLFYTIAFARWAFVA
jgi:hypothetical protein